MLGVVMGHLELSLDSVSEIPEISHHLAEARKAAQNAAEVTRMMLTYLGQTPSQLQPLDLSSVCRRNLTKLRSAMPDEVVFETELPPKGPIINANEFQIKQVIINLVTNAWESLGEGRGSVHLAVKTVSIADIPEKHRFPPDWMPRDKPYACLEVMDTGSGITQDAIEILFDPFYTSKFTGRGLGLAVVIGLVRAHSGVVTVESQVGHGSIFRVFFPLSEEAIIPQTKKKAAAQENKQGLTVLLVEDEYSVRKMTREILMHLGFTVLEAKDGVEALEVFKKHKESIHCVLSDVAMPRMDGWQTLTALRRIDPGIAVILTSGYDAQSMAEDHTDLPQAFLSKPFRLEALRETIQKVTNIV
jgi:CheY-like chemotaxis protein